MHIKTYMNMISLIFIRINNILYILICKLFSIQRCILEIFSTLVHKELTINIKLSN